MIQFILKVLPATLALVGLLMTCCYKISVLALARCRTCHSARLLSAVFLLAVQLDRFLMMTVGCSPGRSLRDFGCVRSLFALSGLLFCDDTRAASREAVCRTWCRTQRPCYSLVSMLRSGKYAIMYLYILVPRIACHVSGIIRHIPV